MKQLKSTIVYYSACFAAAVLVLGLAYFFLFRSVTGENMKSPNIALILAAAFFAGLGIYTIVKGIVPWMAVLANIWRVNGGIQRLLENAGCSMRQGPLGAGKTSSAGYEIVIKAEAQWYELQRKYKLMQPFAAGWNEELSRLRSVQNYNNRNAIFGTKTPREVIWQIKELEDKLFEWRRVRDAYRFWKARPYCFPCFFSNVPIEVDGYEVCKFTIEHVRQQQRLPAYSCVLVDETEWFIDQDLYKDKTAQAELITLFYRFFRQFFGNGGRWIGTQQNANSVFYQMRSVMTSNDTMISQKSILKPTFLLWIRDHWLRKIDKKKSLSRSQAEKFLKFEKFATGIGFRVFDYHISGGIIDAEAGTAWTNQVRLVAPMRLNFTYNDNAFAQLYACKDDKLYAETFISRFVDPDTKVLRHDSAAYAARLAVEKEELKKVIETQNAVAPAASPAVTDADAGKAAVKKSVQSPASAPQVSTPAVPAGELPGIVSPALAEKLRHRAEKKVS